MLERFIYASGSCVLRLALRAVECFYNAYRSLLQIVFMTNFAGGEGPGPDERSKAKGCDRYHTG